MVCQRLALIMGFVSVYLCKWHARVLVCVCLWVAVYVYLGARLRANGCGKNVYTVHWGDYIFKRVRRVHLNTSTQADTVFSLCSRSLNKCGMGSRAGTTAPVCVHAFLSVKVVK